MNLEDRKAAGRRARALRKAKGLTQQGLAKLSGLDQSSISDFETGKTVEPSATFVEALAKAVDSTASYMLRERGAAIVIEVRDPTEAELVQIYRRLGSKLQNALMTSARAMLDHVTTAPIDLQQYAKPKRTRTSA